IARSRSSAGGSADSLATIPTSTLRTRLGSVAVSGDSQRQVTLHSSTTLPSSGSRSAMWSARTAPTSSQLLRWASGAPSASSGPASSGAGSWTAATSSAVAGSSPVHPVRARVPSEVRARVTNSRLTPGRYQPDATPDGGFTPVTSRFTRRRAARRGLQDPLRSRAPAEQTRQDPAQRDGDHEQHQELHERGCREGREQDRDADQHEGVDQVDRERSVRGPPRPRRRAGEPLAEQHQQPDDHAHREDVLGERGDGLGRETGARRRPERGAAERQAHGEHGHDEGDAALSPAQAGEPAPARGEDANDEEHDVLRQVGRRGQPAQLPVGTRGHEQPPQEREHGEDSDEGGDAAEAHGRGPLRGDGRGGARPAAHRTEGRVGERHDEQHLDEPQRARVADREPEVQERLPGGPALGPLRKGEDRPRQEEERGERDAEPDQPVPREGTGSLAVDRPRDEQAGEQEEEAHEEELVRDHQQHQRDAVGAGAGLGPVPERQGPVGEGRVVHEDQHGQQDAQVVDVPEPGARWCGGEGRHRELRRRVHWFITRLMNHRTNEVRHGFRVQAHEKAEGRHLAVAALGGSGAQVTGRTAGPRTPSSVSQATSSPAPLGGSGCSGPEPPSGVSLVGAGCSGAGSAEDAEPAVGSWISSSDIGPSGAGSLASWACCAAAAIVASVALTASRASDRSSGRLATGAAGSGVATALSLPRLRRARAERGPSSDDAAPEPDFSIGSSCTMNPRPLQCSQVSENASTRPCPTRLRVIWTRPSDVTSATWCLVRSRPRHSTRRRSTRSRFDSSTMSMKSMTMMPPMSRSRSWRTISSAASRLFRVTVSSSVPPAPVNLPVLTSTTVMASVRSMTSEPPDGSQTLRSMPLASCSSTRCTANTSVFSAHLDTRSRRSGASSST